MSKTYKDKPEKYRTTKSKTKELRRFESSKGRQKEKLSQEVEYEILHNNNVSSGGTS